LATTSKNSRNEALAAQGGEAPISLKRNSTGIASSRESIARDLMTRKLM
jgi:hypothetical protein